MTISLAHFHLATQELLENIKQNAGDAKQDHRDPPKRPKDNIKWASVKVFLDGRCHFKIRVETGGWVQLVDVATSGH